MTDTKELPPLLFEVHYPERGVHLAPRSWSELEKWLQDEREFWKCIETAVGYGSDSHVQNIYNNHILNRQSQLEECVQRAKTHPGDENIQRDAVNTARSFIEQRYNNYRSLHSSTPEAQYIAGLAKVNAQTAAYAFWVLSGQPDIQVQSHPAYQGYVAAHLFRLGIKQVPQDYSSAWRKLHKAIAVEQDSQRAEGARITGEYRGNLEADRAQQAAQNVSHEEAMKGRFSEWLELKEKHSSEMDAIRRAFREETALKAAVEYFGTKASEQATLAGKARNWGLGIVTAICIATLGIGALLLFKHVTADRTTLGVCLVFAFLFFWLLRIVVRIYLSASHLATDLSARATFVQTYLALIAEGGAIQEKQRDQVIGLVFRPISDGLVKDDAAPPGWMNWLTR